MELTTTWGMQMDEFLQKSRQGHPRKRERWLALFWLAQNISQAEIARRLGRRRETIRAWKQNFEQNGPGSIEFSRSGGRERLLTENQEQLLAYQVATQYPKDVGLSGIRWNLKKAVTYCQLRFGTQVSTETCRRILHRNRVALKLPKKINQSKCTATGRIRQNAL